MTKLLMMIDRRTRYLERAFPKSTLLPQGPTIPIELPAEPWAENYRGLTSIRASLLPTIEKIYGAEAELRNESPIVTMVRHAANAGEKT